MKKCFAGVLFLFLSSAAFAGTFVKWTDEHGVVHYGEKDDSTNHSGRQVTTHPDAAAPASSDADTSAKTAESGPSSVSPDALQGCLATARTMADNKNMSPAYIRARSEQLLSACPGTAYECTNYIDHPSATTCKPVPFTVGPIVSTKTYRR